jgi:putative hydrolase of the HAD superfamily
MGIKTCICTNNFPTRINALNQKFNFLSDFDIHVFSYEIGAIKPDSKIFQTLIDRSGCLPQEIVFADDKQGNVDAALSLGINAFLYTDFENFVSELKNLGVNF